MRFSYVYAFTWNTLYSCVQIVSPRILQCTCLLVQASLPTVDHPDIVLCTNVNCFRDIDVLDTVYTYIRSNFRGMTLDLASQKSCNGKIGD